MERMYAAHVRTACSHVDIEEAIYIERERERVPVWVLRLLRAWGVGFQKELRQLRFLLVLGVTREYIWRFLN